MDPESYNKQISGFGSWVEATEKIRGNSFLNNNNLNILIILFLHRLREKYETSKGLVRFRKAHAYLSCLVD